MIDVQVQLTKREYGKTTSAIIVRKFFYVYIIIAIVACTLIATMLTDGRQWKWTDFLFWEAFALFWIGFPILQYFFGYGWDNYPTAGQHAAYSLTEKGLNVEGETYHAFQAWENFLEVKQMRSSVVLFSSKNQMLIFPNGSFVSEQQRQEVVSFIKSHIPIIKLQQRKSQGKKRVIKYFVSWIAIIFIVYLYMVITKK